MLGKGSYLSVEKVNERAPHMTVFQRKNYKGMQQSFTPGKIIYKVNNSYSQQAKLCTQIQNH